MCEQVDQVYRMYMQVAGKSKSRNEVDIEKPFRGRRRSLECLSLEKFQAIFHWEDTGKSEGLNLCMVLVIRITFRNVHCYLMYFVI